MNDLFDELKKRYDALKRNGGSAEEWETLGNDFFQAGYEVNAGVCYRQALRVIEGMV